MEKDFLNLPVSSVFEYHGESYLVKESSDSTCSGCSFCFASGGCSQPDGVPFCSPFARSDGKSVIFVEI